MHLQNYPCLINLQGLTSDQFRSNLLFSHKFEAESSNEGWLGVELELSTPFTEPYTMVLWCIHSCALSVDKFHQIEKLVL